nr:putative transposase [Ipomoea batatas]
MQQQTPLKNITSNSTFSYGTTSGGDLSSSKIQITTLSEIFVKREIGAFWVPCKIISIESDPNDWYYDSCPSQGCNTKSDFNAGMYDCGKCGDRFFKGVLRYKLKIRVVDINRTTPLLLWDCKDLELLCVKADELKAMQPTHKDDKFSSKPQLVEDDTDSDEFFFSKDDVESPIATTSEKQNVAGNENEAVKRSMLDEFSSTQTSKKKKQIVVKEEKEHTGE